MQTDYKQGDLAHLARDIPGVDFKAGEPCRIQSVRGQAPHQVVDLVNERNNAFLGNVAAAFLRE